MTAFEDKLKQLPVEPGVYFYKNKKGEIIYIGKAANLRNRVRQYFQKSRTRDPKTDALISEIFDVEWSEVETELDALFLEAELIRRYMPPYNILLRDDKSLVYVRINEKDSHPTLTLTRRPLDDKASYYGPYFSALTVKKALKYLRRIFPYSTHIQVPKRVCLQYHLGLCPGLEEDKTSLNDYRKNLKRLALYLKGNRNTLINELEREMKAFAKNLQFEQSAVARNQILALKGLKKQIIFGDRELQDISKDRGLAGLTDILGTNEPLKRIEGFDISHMQGTDTVASMVVFNGGLPERTAYRKFKLRIPGNDDFAHMNEVLSRRLSEKNLKDWGKPNLMLIDGGKGQLSSAIDARAQSGQSIPMIGLAKREETIIIDNVGSNVQVNENAVIKIGGFVKSSDKFTQISLPINSHVVKLLQRIRDESHRFAVSYHSLLKTKRQTSSWLKDIPGIGPSTHKKLIRYFGSAAGVLSANKNDLTKAVGKSRASLLEKYIKANKT